MRTRPNARRTTGLHAHIAYHAADCDGPTGRDWIEELTVDEAHEAAARENAAFDYQAEGRDPEMAWRWLPHDGSEHAFKNRVLTMCVSYYVEPDFERTVTITHDGFNTYCRNDEGGYTRYEVEWCEDRCDAERRGAYDRFAEMMGY